MLRKWGLAQTVAVVSVVGLSLAGCARADARHVASVSSAPATHLVVTNWHNGDDAMLSLRAGVLTMLSDGCVGLANPSEKPVLLRWPAGTRLSEDGKAVMGPSGKRFAVDTEVGFGGGFGLVTVPSECDSSLWAGVFDIQQPL